MAIKGKGKAKSRQVARAPRREPVPVPVPFFKRHRVQVAIAFVLGVAAMVMLVWVTNGIRDDRRAKDEAADQTARKTSVETWKAKLDVQLQTVGVLQYPNPPLVGERLAGVLGQMVRGEETTVTADELQQDADALKAAIKELEDYDLAELIRDAEAFDVMQTDWLLVTRSEIVKGLQAYRQATLMAAQALGADEDQMAELATNAKEVADIGTDLITSAWRYHKLALDAAGISTGLPDQGGGFPFQP